DRPVLDRPAARVLPLEDAPAVERLAVEQQLPARLLLLCGERVRLPPAAPAGTGRGPQAQPREGRQQHELEHPLTSHGQSPLVIWAHVTIRPRPAPSHPADKIGTTDGPRLHFEAVRTGGSCLPRNPAAPNCRKKVDLKN